MGNKVTEGINNKLTREFTDQKVEDALFQMCPLSSSRHDECLVAFYQNHWQTIGKVKSK